MIKFVKQLGPVSLSSYLLTNQSQSCLFRANLAFRHYFLGQQESPLKKSFHFFSHFSVTRTDKFGSSKTFTYFNTS